MASPEVQPSGRMYFLLLSNFSMLSVSSALETLRIANRLGGKDSFEWKICSETGAAVKSSLGIELSVEASLPDVDARDIVFICSGTNVHEATTVPILNWLRRVDRKGITIGGLCTGAYVMAKAGILGDKRATIHWENQDSFTESFPDVELKKTTFVVDDKRYTTAGGTSSIDLMLNIISSREGDKLANLVAEQLLYSNIRILQDDAKISAPNRLVVRNSKIKDVVRQMELALEYPMTIPELAEQVNISTRQLERLFKRYLMETPAQYYLKLRLMRAHNLLTQTDMSIINVGLACGFYTPSVFSKAYRRRFGCSPHQMRR